MSTGMNDAPLQHWFKDTEDKNLLWRVVERRQKSVTVGVDGQPVPMNKNGFDNKPEQHKPCCRPIMITAAISIATTLIVVGAVAALLYFFPDMFSQLWNAVVQAVSGASEGVMKLLGNVITKLKEAALYIWTKISSIF